MDFEKVCMMFSMQEPFYGILLSSVDRIPTDKVPTLGVGRSGNVFKMYYNPDFINQFNTDTILSLLKHEMLHIAFNHFSIWKKQDVSEFENHVRNCAEDMEINCYIDRNKIEKKAGGIFCEDFGLAKSLGTREYFRLIWKGDPKQEEQQSGSGNPNSQCNGGQGPGQVQSRQNNKQSNQQNSQQNQNGNGNQQCQSNQNSGSQGSGSTTPAGYDMSNSQPFDDHSMWPDDLSDDEVEQLTQAVNDLIDFAAAETEKSRGTVPSEMVGKIEQIRKKPKPVTDWKRYFRRYVGNEFTEDIRKSKKRESRRFPDSPGNRHRRKAHILVAIDTSGSVSMPEYLEFFGQIKSLSDRATFHVVECDTKIAHEYDFKGKPNQVLHGGGGTDFQPPINMFLNNRRLYESLIYFTDGYAPIPHNTPKETLWVISSNGDKDRSKYKRNGAKVVFIPKKD